MMKELRALLLVALAMGICVSSFSAGDRLCLITLEVCCSHDTLVEASSDCCDSTPEKCCVVVLSDEFVMLSPDIVVVDANPLFELEYLSAPLNFQDESATVRAVIPDPPPLSGRERLARLEIQLI